MLPKTAPLALALAAVLAASSQPAATAKAQPTGAIPELVGAYAEWVQGRGAKVDLAVVDLDATRQALARMDPSSIPVESALSPPDARERQRRLLTSFALEVAALGARRHAASAARLIEWACPYVRSHSPMNDFDRAWELAALSALEGGIDSAVLHAHLDHTPAAIAADPRYLLARGIAEEQFSAPGEVLTRGVAAADMARAREAVARAEGERYRAAERALARFKEAAASKDVAAEATLRMAHVQLGLGRYDTAIATLATIDALDPEPAVVYLAHLFRGLAHEGYGRTEAARAAYRDALKISPGAHSATMRLAALDYLHGRGDDPNRLLDQLLGDDDPRRDPWWSYYAADWRHWYPRIERVRAMMRGDAR